MALPLTVVDLPTLRTSSDLHDVTFIFNENDEKIKANKTVLACASAVFKTQFFGSMPGIIPAEKIVYIEDSNLQTFNIFLDMLHNVKTDMNLMDLKVLGELFYLADKYQVKDWKSSIIRNVKSRKIKIDDVLDAVKIAEAKAHLTEFAEAINFICADFVHNSSSTNLSELFMKSEVGDANSAMLHRFMAKSFSLVNEVSRKEPNKLKVETCKSKPQHQPYTIPGPRVPEPTPTPSHHGLVPTVPVSSLMWQVQPANQNRGQLHPQQHQQHVVGGQIGQVQPAHQSNRQVKPQQLLHQGGDMIRLPTGVTMRGGVTMRVSQAYPPIYPHPLLR